MSNSILDLYNLQNITASAVDNVSANEYPSASLSLTRTATLAITTAGTQITWQSETRNFGFTWSGTTITIPTAGYYAIGVQVALLASTTLQIRLVVNSVNNAVIYNAAPTSTGNGFMATATFTEYFQTGDTFVVSLTPGANTTLNQNAETVAAPSPFVHIVQLSGAI